MRIFIILYAVFAFSGTVSAQGASRIVDTTEHTCAGLRTLIQDEGSVILGSSRTRVFGNSLGCRVHNAFGRDQKGIPEICPTSDVRFCNAGFKCVVDFSSDDT